MGWRTYGEPEPKESPWAAFLIGLLAGTLGFCSFGWVVIWLGWMEPETFLAIGIGIGLCSGAVFVAANARREREYLPKRSSLPLAGERK